MIIAPSILAADFSKLAVEVEQCGSIEWLHCDVMDGHFVPNISFGAPIVQAIRKHTDAVVDVHLMIEQPESYIKDFVAAGADNITIHFEVREFEAALAMIKKAGKKAGLSIKPGTKVEGVLPYLKDVDIILVMSVEPGFGGQEFMPEAVDKITQLREYIDANDLNVIISVDGGINADTAQMVKEAGADVAVAGSSVFKSKDYQATIKELDA